MRKIELIIHDDKDLLLLYVALNQLQHNARIGLARNNTEVSTIEQDWIRETIDDWDRIMSLKVQIDNFIKAKREGDR